MLTDRNRRETHDPSTLRAAGTAIQAGSPAHVDALPAPLTSGRPTPLVRAGRRPWLPSIALAAPIVAAVIFVAIFASAAPLTDEWIFVRSILDLGDVHPGQPDWFQQVVERGTWRFNGHSVVVPFLVYWSLGEAVGFDARVFVGVTLATFAVLLLVYRRSLRESRRSHPESWWAAVPIALVLFSPAHYMEFLWGFECTLALSIVFPMLGLAVLDTIRADSRILASAGKLAAGVALITLGTLSSFGGFLGFIAALVLLALRPLGPSRKAALITGLAACAVLAFFWIVRDERHAEALAGAHANLWFFPTAIGGAVLSTPITLYEFGFDLRSAIGLVGLASLLAVAVWALARGRLGHVAFPLAIAAFGLLATASVAFGRGHLANWHLQYVLMIVCGTYAAAYVAWREDSGSWTTRLALAGSLAVALASIAGSWNAFTTFGPVYRDYVQRVERYMQRSLARPDGPRPCGLDLDPDAALYLSALGSAPFRPERTDLAELRPASGYQLFINNCEMPVTFELYGPQLERTKILVVWPTASAPRAVRLEIGGHAVDLRRIDVSRALIEPREGIVCFIGLLLPGTIPRGATPLTILAAR